MNDGVGALGEQVEAGLQFGGLGILGKPRLPRFSGFGEVLLQPFLAVLDAGIAEADEGEGEMVEPLVASAGSITV